MARTPRPKDASAIEVSASDVHPERPETVVILDFGSQYSMLIARRVRECNVYCEMLPYNAPQEEIERLRPRAFILSGGPASVYEDGAPHAPSFIFEAGLPVLGICYGMQLLALHRGGRLVYDIPTDRPDAAPHRLPELDGRHAVQVAAGSRLARILGDDAGPVNSLHHQGVSDPGDGMRVSARADDGLIEAIESYDNRFCIGVQWHPEKLEGPHREGLFGAFAAACSARATGKRGLE